MVKNFGVTLTLTVVLMLSLFAFQHVKAESNGTIYIRADGSLEGTDKIQLDGNVYTFTDAIAGSIVVERDNIVVDGGGYTLHGMGIGNGTDLSGRKNVTVKNLKITQFATGIYIYDYSNSGNNTITGNTMVNCGYGLYMDGSHNNTIIGNNFNDNDCGVFTSASHFNVFKNNQLSDNQRNFIVQGGYLAAFVQYMDTSNTMNGKPIYYWIEEQDKTVPSDAGYIALIGCESIKVQNLKLTGNGHGILLFSTKDSTITRNIIKGNDMGIFFLDSLNITISENVITNNGIGIRIGGTFPVYSQNNMIHGNNITNNDVGIYIFDCSNNTIYRNNIANNGYGIRINGLGGEAANNLIHHNNFVNNTADVPGHWHTIVFQEVWVPPPRNVWDYSKEGNYWSDYVTRYPNATEIDGSGIWDTPYVISENNQDSYPLMHPVVIPELPDEAGEPEPFPTIWVVAIATVIVVGVGCIIYFAKFRKKSGKE
jgi:parallel beta-helix repeat protein